MIPILHENTATDFGTLGIGALPQAIGCTVTEEINGIYELAMAYPVSGLRAGELAVDRIITAPNNDQDHVQPFRIYSAKPSLSGRSILVKAEHISYQLRHTPVMPFQANTIPEAVAAVGGNAVTDCPFTYSTDFSAEGEYQQQLPAMARNILKAMAEQCNGELEYDRYDVKLCKQRGQDNGVVIAYGKNLSDLEQETNITDMVDSICCYWAKDGVVVMGGVASNDWGYSYKRAKLIDATSSFVSKPTSAQLTALADSYLSAKTVAALVSMQLGYVPLWQTAQYKKTAPYERVRLGDTVTVCCQPLGINSKARITGLVYDVLKERFVDVRVGAPKPTLDRTLAKLLRTTT